MNIVTSEEEARNFYLYGFKGSGHDLHECFHNQEIEAYYSFSNSELEKEWAEEECSRMMAKILSGGHSKYSKYHYFKEAQNWYRKSNYPLDEYLKAAEITSSEHLTDTEALDFAEALITAAGRAAANESNLVRMTELIGGTVKKYSIEKLASKQWKAESVIKNYRILRTKILGVSDLEEAEKAYTDSKFYMKFRTKTAEQRWNSLVTEEHKLLWKQKFIDCTLSAENQFVDMLCVRLIAEELFSCENAEKLYKRLTDYQNCLYRSEYDSAVDYIAEIVRLLFEHDSYKLLRNYAVLSSKILEELRKPALLNIPLSRLEQRILEKINEDEKKINHYLKLTDQ